MKERLSPLPILRRLCMLCGIRIVTRNYDFSSSEPFTINDVLGIVPRIKSSTDVDSHRDLPVITEALNSITVTNKLVQQGHYNLAFEKAYESMQWLQDVSYYYVVYHSFYYSLLLL